MLWVSADPGSGKSVLARYLIDSVLPTPESRTTCYFFFKDNFEEQRSAITALCCILLQLFTANRSLLCETIIDRFEIVGEWFSSSFSELWSAFLIAAKNNNAGEIVCVLDALDECNSSDRFQLITKLKELYNKPTDFNLKFLVTSRPIREILHALRPLEVPESLLIHLNGDGDEEKKKISQEIDIFIDARVHEISTKLQLENSKRNLLLKRLKGTQNRTYLWVYLILDLIEKDPNINISIDKDTIDEVTSQLPQTINEAYEKILSTSCKHEEAQRLLQIVVAAARPLTLEEMYVAFTLKDNHQTYDGLKTNLGSKEIERFGYDIRDRCGLFVRVVDSRIYLIHQTAKEFLVRREEESLHHPAHQSTRWGDSLRMRHCHQLLADICMQHLLNFAEFETDPFTKDTKLSDYAEKYPFIDYSANNWVVHLKESQAGLDRTTIQSILTLCDTTTKRCLTWLRIYWTSTNTDFPENITTLMATSYFGFAPAVKLLLKSNYDVDLDCCDDRYGRSALSWAAGNGFDVVVTKLLKGSPWKGIIRLPFRGAEIDSLDKYGRTPLVYAILNKQESVAEQLLRAGARADLEDNIEGTPLYYAICSGQNKLAAQMLKKGNEVGPEHSIRKKLLFSAAMRGHDDVIELLLEGGEISPDEKDSGGHTALALAAKGGHEGVVQLLLDSGADVEVEDYDRWKPLTFSAYNGHKRVVQLLLDRGASIETRSIGGSTPLAFAARNGHEGVAELLLDRGADVEAEDDNGRTPLVIAAKNGYEGVVKLLLDKGADVEIKDDNGQTPLVFAVEHKRGEVVKLLLDKGANIEAKGNNGRMPLVIAANHTSGRIVELLLNRGADVEAKDINGETAMFPAVRKGNEETIRLLVKNGAHILAMNNQGITLLMLALWSRRGRVIQLLSNLLGYKRGGI